MDDRRRQGVRCCRDWGWLWLRGRLRHYLPVPRLPFPLSLALRSEASGTELVSRSSREEFVWDVKTGKQIIGSVEFSTIPRTAKHDHWLVVPSGNDVLLVDLSLKNTPDEKVRRVYYASPKPVWHEEQAIRAERSGNWFSATVHRAWQFRFQPESQTAYDRLKAAHGNLDSKIADLLPIFVAESLGQRAPDRSDSSRP